MLVAAGAPEPSGAGWYYDTFSADLSQRCKVNEPHRIAFTPDARPPTGVVVQLECLTETQHYASTRVDVSRATAQPEIGSPCDMSTNGTSVSGDAACVVGLDNGGADQGMFCHPERNVCVLACVSDADCPPAWVCDGRPETRAGTRGRGAICVNPTCGTD
jgi:hypothetical protein